MLKIKRLGITITVLSFSFIIFSLPAHADTPDAPEWDIGGSWNISWEYNGTSYNHGITLRQDSDGNLTGDGGHPAGGAWQLYFGSVSGNTFTFSGKYIDSSGVVTPGAILYVDGSVAPDGTMSGTWADKEAGGRTGSWKSVSGIASPLPDEEEFWHGYLFETELTAAEEVHDATPALATAHAGAWFANEGTAMNYWLSVFSEEPVVDAHFHCGSPGENGPAIVDLITNPINSTGKWYGEIGRKYITHEDILQSGRDCESVIGYSIFSVPDLA